LPTKAGQVRRWTSSKSKADRLYFEMPQGQVADQLEAGLLTRLVDAPGAFSPL
jgi:hypothetical protein